LPIKLKDLDTWLPPEVLNEYNKHENKTKKSTDEDLRFN
jgi:hypothetical protein